MLCYVTITVKPSTNISVVLIGLIVNLIKIANQGIVTSMLH